MIRLGVHVGAWLVVVWACVAAPGADVSQESLIRELASPQFEARQRAHGALAELGVGALPSLEIGAAGENAETRRRCVGLIEQLFVEGCPDSADRAEQSLMRLADGDVREARSVLEGHAQLRERRAIAAIRELGGRVTYSEVQNAFAGNNLWLMQRGMGAPPIPGVQRVRLRIWLLPEWTGGEEGLWHVSRLEGNWSAKISNPMARSGVMVTQVRGNGLDFGAVQALAARLPNAEIDERGATFGVICSQVAKCEVSDVVVGGPAHLAGILPGDSILAYNGRPIGTFNDLVTNLLDEPPGAEVMVRIDRFGQEIDMPVIVGDWKDLDTGSEEPPPERDPYADEGEFLPEQLER